MRLSYSIPDHILRDILSVVINSTQYRGWQLSLRLVNYQFNEAVLYVYYLRERLVANTGHSLLFDCRFTHLHRFSSRKPPSRLKETYAVRFNFQRLLTTQQFSSSSAGSYHPLQQWREALMILRGEENLIQRLDSEQARFYSTCSHNPAFNDAPSAILSEAIGSYLDSGFLVTHDPTYHDYQAHPTVFWIALSACVLGDLQLLDTYLNKLTFPINGINDSLIVKQPAALLKVAIRHKRHHIVRFLLEKFPHTMSDTRNGYIPIQAAFFCEDDEYLNIIFENMANMPHLPNLLALAVNCGPHVLFTHPSSIRSLSRYYTFLMEESPRWMIWQLCAVDDVTVLEEFSGAELPSLLHRLKTNTHSIIGFGNINLLRLLIRHGLITYLPRRELTCKAENALLSNQIECYQALYRNFEDSRSPYFFQHLGRTENADEIMTEFLSIYRSVIFEQSGGEGNQSPTLAQRALWNAIRWLRPRNIQLLLNEGVRVYPWQEPNDPFDIQWPYFNQNREAFLHTQEVLDAFGLPKLRIIV